MSGVSTEKILGYDIAKDGVEACCDQSMQWAMADSGTRVFVCANPHSLHVAESDELFKRALRDADLVTPDGVGILLASKMLGREIDVRVTGGDVFYGLSRRMNEKGGMSCFFLGSTDDVLNQIREKMAREYPNIKVSTYSPPFKPEFDKADVDAMIKVVNEAEPDVLWVGMTAPKQEKWIYQNKDKLDVRFIGAIGAVFDFYIGRIKRSHPLFMKLGLEWLPRLVQEPRRLWRRNFVSNPLFLFRVILSKFGS